MTLGAGCLLLQDGQVLLVQPNYGPAKGSWILPGGFIEPGERLTDGALRELFEETGQTGKVITPVCIRHRVQPMDVYFIFHVASTGSQPLIPQTEELLGARYWPIDQALHAAEVRPMTQYFLRGALSSEHRQAALPDPFSSTDTVYWISPPIAR